MIREDYFPKAMEELLRYSRLSFTALELTTTLLPISEFPRYLQVVKSKFFLEELLNSLVKNASGLVEVSKDSRVITSYSADAIRFSNLAYKSGLNENIAEEEYKALAARKMAVGTRGDAYDAMRLILKNSVEKTEEIHREYAEFSALVNCGKEKINLPYFVLGVFNEVISSLIEVIKLVLEEKDFLRRAVCEKEALNNFIFFSLNSSADSAFSLAKVENDIILGKRVFCYPVLMVDFAYQYSL